MGLLGAGNQIGGFEQIITEALYNFHGFNHEIIPDNISNLLGGSELIRLQLPSELISYLGDGLVGLVHFQEFRNFLPRGQTLRRQFLLQKHQPVN